MADLTRQYVIDSLAASESWRLFRIMSEIVDGIETLSELPRCVSIFGSSRGRPEDEIYKQAEKLAGDLAKAGYGVITGGGPGLMEAANKGAYEAGGTSVGLHIHLPLEQNANRYLTVRSDYKHFFIRKLMFIKYAVAYVVMPGGPGTLDEMFEALVLVQTNRIKPFPIILYGREFWSGLLDWMKVQMITNAFLREDELNLLTVLDTPSEVINYIKRLIIM